MASVQQDSSSDSDNAARDPIVVLAADDNFAMPLAATVRSALDNLAPGRKLSIYLLDGGFTEPVKERLLQSWPEDRYHSISWLDVDAAALRHLPTSGHANLVTYYRILMPWLLPTELQRVIYLDSDLIVRADLAELWDRELEENLCLAAQDCSAPYFDASAALANFDQCGKLLASPTPIPNFRELGLDPQAAYFNAGVLVVDLPAWRNTDLSTELLACLQQNKQHVLWWDQYALNVVLAGRWGALDARWNQGTNIFAYPDWQHSPYDCQTYELLRDDPFIVHFTTRHKPWHMACRHPLCDLFFEYVDRTAWAGWRPSWLNDPKALSDLLKAQERRLRHARQRLQSRASQWWRQRRERASA